jgi:hypothetical protein
MALSIEKNRAQRNHAKSWRDTAMTTKPAKYREATISWPFQKSTDANVLTSLNENLHQEKPYLADDIIGFSE